MYFTTTGENNIMQCAVNYVFNNNEEGDIFSFPYLLKSKSESQIWLHGYGYYAIGILWLLILIRSSQRLNVDVEPCNSRHGNLQRHIIVNCNCHRRNKSQLNR
jgi:hypothetical protein